MLLPVAPSPVSVPELATQYATSQYCLSGYRAQHGWDKLIPTYQDYCSSEDLFDGNIADPELFTLAGWEYTGGADPSSINPETQPLIKYLFGISTRLFTTPLVVEWLMGLTVLTLTYLLARQLLPTYLALLPASLLIFDQLFRAQFTSAYVDLGQTALILAYLSLLKRPRLSMLTLGLLALAKSFSIGILMYLVTLLYFALINRAQLKIIIKHTYLAVLTYLVGYTMFFFNGHGLRDFFILHLDILRLYKSYVPEYPKGEIFRIIVGGQWRQWYPPFETMRVSEWSLLWPLSLGGSLITLLVGRVRRNPTVLLHLTWVFSYLLFVSLRLPFPRYLLPILPSMYILLAHTLSACYYSYNGRKR